MLKKVKKTVKNKEKLLGLNMMVAKGGAEELRRCMTSMKGDLFDEIVIINAAPERDEEVIELANEYADIVDYFKWCDDFAAARNFAFSLSTTPWIFWCDADDVLKESEYTKLLEFKPKIPQYDMILMDYVYSHDANDKPVLVLPRERIVKRCDYIKWHDPIHEYLNMNIPPEKIIRTKISLDHYRMKPFDPKRNLETLRKVYKNGGASERIKFYYGKELADCGFLEESVPVLEEYIDKGADFRDNLCVACIRISKYYYDKKDYASAKTYAFKGVRFNSI